MRTPRIHNLSGNSTVSSPHEVIVLDTESFGRQGDDIELHTLRLWVAKIYRRHGRNPSRPRIEQARGHGTRQLAEWIDWVVTTDPTVWLYTHNLNFDLGVTRLPLELIDLGWSLRENNLASDAPWARMARGGKSLRMCDSASVFPMSAEQIGKHVGVGKPPLPAQGDTDEVWFRRCEADVNIIGKALLQTMDWWDQQQLGHWAATGPRSGWNAMRHMCVAQPGGPAIEPRGPRSGSWGQHGDGHVVIDPDPDARKFERLAIYQGRRESFRTGELPAGSYAELDFQHAFLTVACEMRLPCRRGARFDSLPLSTPYLDNDEVGIIARVRLSTRETRYPYRHDNGILHPVGQFETVLCGPEITEARRRGELVSIGPGYVYRLSYHMQPWALWLQDLLDGPADGAPPAVLLMLKAHSRSVFGKWAAHTSTVIDRGTTPVEGWLAEHAIDVESGHPCTILHMAGQWSMILRDQESDDAFPAVLAWVQSHMRLGLGAVLDQLPARAVVSCSADSVLVDLQRAPVCTWQLDMDTPAHIALPTLAKGLCVSLNAFCDPLRLRVKGLYTKVTVLSPQHLRLDGALRMAGIGGQAEEKKPNEFTFLTWPGLGRQLALDEPAGYVRQLRKVNLSGMRVSRWMAGDGCTGDVEARIAAGGTTELVWPATAGCRRHGAPWAESQWPGLPLLTSEFWEQV